MSRRRRRVKIKSSSRLFAFILFNLLLLATCITAHYQQQQQQAQDQYQGPVPILSTVAVATKRDQQQNLQLHLNSTTIPTSSQQEAASGGGEDDDDSTAGGDESSGGGAPGQQHELNNEANSEPLNVNQASINHNHQNHHYQHHNQLQQQQQQQQQQQSNAVPSIGDLCSSLPASSVKHLKLCKLISKSASADEAVALGAARGLAECRNQFKSERWNCTHSAGDHHLLTSKLAQSVGNRESAFVQAIAAAGIVHSIAHACSIGSLSDCACDKTRIGLIRQGDQIWKWGGCSNNIPHGMMFAKHLVDLLDAVHEHAQHQEQQQQHQLQQLQLHQAVHHQLAKRHLLRHRRSLSSRHREPNQVHGRLLQGTAADQLQAGPDEQLAQQQQQQLLNFCQKNQNISHTAQIQLIKSLLSKNSLERHQDFRLAMNMHNNRVGRMAVMKNMEVKCRCHGLSGSCSVKTCWLRLPDFQTIGTYLKRKYDSSIHLPTAINVNKLIPMMDRQEISAILLQNDQFDQDSGSSEQSNVTTEPGRQPEFAALTSAGGLDNSQNNINNINNNNFNRLTSQTLIGPPTHVAGGSNLNNATFVQLNATAPQLSQQQHHLHHLSYYERHKQLERLAGSAAGATNLSSKQAGQYSTTSNRLQTTTSLYLHGDEIQIVPMSQQQYQSLLRETKLCNNISNNNNNRLGTAAAAAATGSTTGSNRLVTRDLSGHQNNHLHHRQSRKHGNYRHKKLSHHHQHHQHDLQVYGTGGVGANLNSGEHRQHGSGSNLKYGANSNHQQQHLIGQLLHANKRDVDDLIHLHKSPDYCQMDARHGFAGVQARACSNDPMASNSCDKLCCGRGYETRETQIRYKCDCKFQYCCKIHCNYCEKTVVEYVCK